MTPKEAISLGADYLVIGRPITEAKDPKFVVKEMGEIIGHDWKEIWAYPAIFAAVVLVIFILTFKNEKIIVQQIKNKNTKTTKKKKKEKILYKN